MQKWINLRNGKRHAVDYLRCNTFGGDMKYVTRCGLLVWDTTKKRSPDCKKCVKYMKEKS